MSTFAEVSGELLHAFANELFVARRWSRACVAAAASPRCRGGHGKAVRCGGGVCCGVRRVRRWRGVEQFGAHRDGVALLCVRVGVALPCALQGLARRRGTACACAWRDTLNVACARGWSCLRALARLGARLGGRARGVGRQQGVGHFDHEFLTLPRQFGPNFLKAPAAGLRIPQFR